MDLGPHLNLSNLYSGGFFKSSVSSFFEHTGFDSAFLANNLTRKLDALATGQQDGACKVKHNNNKKFLILIVFISVCSPNLRRDNI